MKKFMTSLFTVLIIVGIAGVVSSFKLAKIAFSGKTVNLNEATQSDFTKPAKIEGEIYYVYDCIAVEEVTHTSYGIETGKDETNFYLIETYTKDQYEKVVNGEGDTSDCLTVLYSTGNEEMIEKLDKMVEDWYAYEDEMYSILESATTEADLEKIKDIPIPSDTVEISGIIDEYDDMKKLNGYRDEYIEAMGYEGSELTEYIDTYCVDMIITGANVDSGKMVFIIAALIAVVGIVGLIGSLVASKKKKASEELY